jgi:hypothetical protein
MFDTVDPRQATVIRLTFSLQMADRVGTTEFGDTSGE